jgi:hypothetical protein
MIADGDQKSILLRLHDQVDESKVELTASEIFDSFRPKIDPLAVEFALDALVTAGLVVTVVRQPTQYRISRAGIAEVEHGYDISTTINPGTGIAHRTYSERAPLLVPRPIIDWTKWGTILTGIAIVVTIFIAVIS